MLFGKQERIVNRILIVEDEPLTAFDNENMLLDAGYVVVATHDGFDEAVETLESEQVDLILSDVRLSGSRSGVDLARIAKSKGIPLIFVTGMPPDNAHELALGTLMKPYQARSLKAALESVDRHLSGKKPRPPKGFTIYETTTA